MRGRLEIGKGSGWPSRCGELGPRASWRAGPEEGAWESHLQVGLHDLTKPEAPSVLARSPSNWL